MHFQSIFVQTISVLFAVQATAHALPTDLKAELAAVGDKLAAAVGAGRAGVEAGPGAGVGAGLGAGWFLGNVCKRPPAATCLFYTRGLSKAARIFAKKGGADMTTIWEMWNSALYDKRQIKSNPLRCIMQKKEDRNVYFQNMSTAMATMCDVFATVMDKSVDSSKDPNGIRMDGIWGQHEFPTLQKSGNEGKVNQIEATNRDGTIVFTFWTRGSSRLGRGLGRWEKRDTCGIDNDQTAADFDEGGDYPVDW
ncbi:hypothetical protein DL765_009819 [Monosporascus sp. GIB2]|nr:hypothetical protein DL765_009819 [Monosporascus sp. GIB2]